MKKKNQEKIWSREDCKSYSVTRVNENIFESGLKDSFSGHLLYYYSMVVVEGAATSKVDPLTDQRIYILRRESKSEREKDLYIAPRQV